MDTGAIAGAGAAKTDDLVLFWGGGKHGSVESLKTFLTQSQSNPGYEKGLDVFNRSSRRMNLPATLLRNKNLKLLMGLSEIISQHSSPCRVDTGILRELREMPMAYAQGARTFDIFRRSIDKKRCGSSLQE